MTTQSFTMIENGRSLAVDGMLDGGTLRLAAAPVLDALGWTQKPEGLCQGDVCIPIGHRPDLIGPKGIDLLGLSEAIGRPVAIDREEAVVSFGAEAAVHGAQLAKGFAPDFTLPDLTGKEHSLSGFKGKKVLLIAYASW